MHIPVCGFACHHFANLCKIATLKKTVNWFSRPIITLCRAKVLQNAPKGGILQYFRPSLSYQLSLRSLFCLLSSGRLHYKLVHVFFQAATEYAEKHIGGLDLLINCAGILHPSGRGETSLKDVSMQVLGT